ncbi:4-hydroxyphenylpyruvate dioxygenase [bacterium]|nr:4-hydroxyphenylpyruvate dioxygenase [bacterium]
MSSASGDPLGIEGYDYIEIYCDSARQTAYYLTHGFGFVPVAYRGPETDTKDAVSILLKQGEAYLIITSPLRSTSPLCEFVHKHSVTARDVAFTVANCEAFYYEAIKRGATSVQAPTEYSDQGGTVRRASIRTYGDVIHSCVERKGYQGHFFPGFVPYKDIFHDRVDWREVGFKRIDHVVGNVELGQMNTWVKFYEDILGFSQMIHFSDKDISTEYSALMSKVMTGGQGKVKMPINEPAEGRRKSQIEEYLEFHNGPGVQHIAFLTDDIIATVRALHQRGVYFLRVPKSYYDEVPQRVGTIKEDLKTIETLGVLVDRDDDGYLLQLFTKPLQDRPTLFFEIIQREGSSGFGKGNFKALFEAIEREQADRGNL